MGISAGGTATTWIVENTNRFKAAAAEAPVFDFASWRLGTDHPSIYFQSWAGIPSTVPQQRLWDNSPASRIANVVTPTLVIVGSDDHVTGTSEAEQLYTALKLRRVATALLIVPGAGHRGLQAHPSQNAARIQTIIDWFDRYRAGATSRR